MATVPKIPTTISDESPARTQRDMERVQLEDLNGRLQQYIMKQRAKDASREVWERDLRAVQGRSEAAIQANTRKYDEYLKLMRQQRDEHASAREELQVRVARQENTVARLKEQLSQEKQFQEDLGERISNLTRDLEQRTTQLASMKEDLVMAQQKAKNSESGCSALQERISELEEAADEHEHETSSLRSRLKSAEQDLAITTQTASEERTRLEKEIEDLTKKNTAVEDMVREEFAQQLAEIIEDYRKQCSEDKARITRELKSHYVPKLHEARLAFEESSKREREMQEQNGVLQDERQAFKQQTDRLSEIKQALEKRVNDLEEMLAEERNIPRSDAVLEKDAEIQRQHERINQLEEDFDKLMDVKIQLVLEIEKYSQLLEEEESRLGIDTPGRKRKRTRFAPDSRLHLLLDEKKQCLVLENRSENDVDLSGWSLQSHANGKSFAFDESMVVAPRESVRIWVGEDSINSATESDEEGVPQLVWDDVSPQVLSKDNLVLLNPDGQRVDKLGVKAVRSAAGDNTCLVM